MNVFITHHGLALELEAQPEDGTNYFAVKRITPSDEGWSIAEIAQVLTAERRAIEISAERQLMRDIREDAA